MNNDAMDKDAHSPDELDVKSLWAAIADREAQLLALIEASAQIVWVTDNQGRVLADPPLAIAHLTWGAFTGLNQDAMGGHGWLAAIHPDDVPTITAVMKTAIASGQSMQCEQRVRHVSGEWRWLLTHGNPVRTPTGGILGWIGTCIDVTSTKKTEAALRQSQQRLVAALEAGQMGTWTWSMDSNEVWWDEAAVKLWGRVGNEETDHSLAHIVQFIHDDDRPGVQKTMLAFIKNGTSVNVEFRAKRLDGLLQWLACRARMIRTQSGEAQQVIGVFVDITKEKLAEESLRQAQKMQALGTLAGGVAHDFNNLLLAISGNARLARSEINTQHPAHTSLEEILKASARATDLVRRILTFSARPATTYVSTQVVTTIQDALNLLRVSIPPHIELRAKFDAAPLLVAVSETELQQIVMNLVTNAMHAIGDANGEIVVQVDSDDASSMARIVVRDNGCGMTATVRERVFDPFFTTKPVGAGTGLGLAVVHGIVQACHGTVSVESESGVGSTFTVLLPLTENAEPSDNIVDAITRRGNGEHILYVDDDEAVVFLIERTLSQLGYRVTTHTDAQAALTAFKAHADNIDVVVTDLSMPGMNGFDLAQAIKQIRAATPIVMTSGYVRPQDEVRARELGIEQVILKPNTVEELGQVLDKLCQQLRHR